MQHYWNLLQIAVLQLRPEAVRRYAYPRDTIFPLRRNRLRSFLQSDQLHQAMIPVVIVLLLLTALVATDPSTPSGDGG